MSSNPLTNNNYTPKIKRFQITRWFFRWIFVFLLMISLSVFFTPLFIKTDAQAMKLSYFLENSAWIFLAFHLMLAVSALWWFPWYVKRQGQVKGAAPEAIQKVIGYKWIVVGILVAFTLMLRFI